MHTHTYNIILISDLSVINFKEEGTHAKPRGFLKKGALALAIIGITTIWWGTDTFNEVGEVILTDESEVVIRYTHDKLEKELKLNPRAVSNSEMPFEVNERLTIYFTNFNGAVGAERANGEAYLF